MVGRLAGLAEWERWRWGRVDGRGLPGEVDGWIQVGWGRLVESEGGGRNPVDGWGVELLFRVERDGGAGH